MEDPRFAILSESGRTVNRMILGYLRDSGYHVDIFHDQESALRSIDKCGCILLLADIDIPGLDILHLLSNTHQICPETSVVIMAGNERLDSAMQALKLGAADILVKPIDLFYLDATLEKSIRLNRSKRDHMRILKYMKQAQDTIEKLEQRYAKLLEENKRLAMEIQKLQNANMDDG